MEKNIIKSSFLSDMPYYKLCDFVRNFNCRLIKTKRVIYNNKECILIQCVGKFNVVPIKPFKLIFSDFELEKTLNNPGVDENLIEGLWRRINASHEYNTAYYNYFANKQNSTEI